MLALPIQSLSQFPVSVPGTVALAAVTAAAATDDKLSSCTVASSATLLSSRLYTSDIRCKKCKKIVNCAIQILSILWYRAFSLLGQFAPRSKSVNRTVADSLPSQLAPWSFRSLAISLPGTFAQWPFRSGRSKSLFIVKKFIQRNQSNLKHAVERAT